MSNIVIYTTNSCPYCIRAKNLLDSKGLSYEEINVSDNKKQRELLVKKANGQMTVPQIFINDKHIGGYDSLVELNNNSDLNNLLKTMK